MNLTTAYDIVGMVGTIVATGGALWSRRAAKLSAPTGNGFAATVLSALVRIEARQDRMESRLDHLSPPADHHV